MIKFIFLVMLDVLIGDISIDICLVEMVGRKLEFKLVICFVEK